MTKTYVKFIIYFLNYNNYKIFIKCNPKIKLRCILITFYEFFV